MLTKIIGALQYASLNSHERRMVRLSKARSELALQMWTENGMTSPANSYTSIVNAMPEDDVYARLKK